MYFEMLIKNVDSKLLPCNSDVDWLKSNKQMESMKDMEEDKPLEVSMFEPEKKKVKKKVLLDSDIFVSNKNLKLKNKILDNTKEDEPKKKRKPKPTTKKTLGKCNGKTAKLSKSQTNLLKHVQITNNEINAHHGSRKAKLDKHIGRLSNRNKKCK